MSTFGDRSNKALLVVDMQVGVIAQAYDREAVIANVGALVDRARAGGIPVVWVRHHDEGLQKGDEGWFIVPELGPAPGEPTVDKSYGDAFEDTELEDILATLRVSRLVVVGAQTDACIRSTLHGALVRGYDTFLVTDAHTTEDMTRWGAPKPAEVVAHTNLYWRHQTAPRREAGAFTTAEADLTS